jgi:hypothetical protein
MTSTLALNGLRFFGGALLGLAAATAEPMREQIEAYQADADLLSRHWGISGDSAAELTRERQLLESWRARRDAVDFSLLGPDGQVDSVLFRNELEASLARLAQREAERAELAPWLPFRGDIDALADARVRGEPLAPDQAAGKLAAAAEAAGTWQKRLKQARDAAKDSAKPTAAAGESSEAGEPLPLPTADQAARCAEVTADLARSLQRWFENEDGFHPEFTWWVKRPHEEAAKALEEYRKFLREEVAGHKDEEDAPLLGKAIGDEELRRQLGFEFIPYSPEELIGIAEREFAWCETEMKRAAAEMGLGEDWKQALARAKSRHVPPGSQETVVREEGQRATAFVKDRQLVTVPPDCEEWWGTRMLSPGEQKQIPYAAYSGHDVLVAYAGASMKHADKLMAMRGNSRPFMHNVVPHELIPGHHLQSFLAARHRPYRRLFGTPFFVEGWAVHWEIRFWDLGYHTTPEDRVGALFWRMHRCARILVTLKFHLGQMKPDEMVAFLTDRVGHEKFGATSEVRRFIQGNYAPLYQSGYMLGALQFRALHRELVGSGRMTERDFHDAVLRLGPIPVELIRASLVQSPLTADFTTRWRFDDPP